jgi:acyl-CoA synthetase
MPDERFGEKVCAVIELKPGESTISLKEVRAFMEKEKVAEYKWPEKVVVVDKLPRTPTGKVLKYVLRERLARKEM